MTTESPDTVCHGGPVVAGKPHSHSGYIGDAHSAQGKAYRSGNLMLRRRQTTKAVFIQSGHQ